MITIIWRQLKKPLLDKVKKAVLEYKMITEGDHIAIGVSGGKDSLVLLYSLAMLKKIIPIKYSLHAITIDLGWKNDYTQLIKYCKDLDIPLTIKETEIGQIIFEERKEKNPCSLCAKMRRGAINNLAKELGCNKVALGHHLDDVVETFLLSLTFEGRIYCFQPSTYLSRVDLTVIRPLIFIPEETTNYLGKKLNLPLIKNQCPAEGKTKREEIKLLFSELEKNNPLVKNRVLTAIVKQIWKST